MLSETPHEQGNVVRPRRIATLAPSLEDENYRQGYWTQQLRAFLGTQIRALRGEMSQSQFGRRIGKPQNVVSRIENENYQGLGLQTLIDIATKLDITLIVRFADWPTFLRATEDYSDAAFSPRPYDRRAVETLAHEASADSSPAPSGTGLSLGLPSVADAMEKPANLNSPEGSGVSRKLAEEQRRGLTRQTQAEAQWPGMSTTYKAS